MPNVCSYILVYTIILIWSDVNHYFFFFYGYSVVYTYIGILRILMNNTFKNFHNKKKKKKNRLSFDSANIFPHQYNFHNDMVFDFFFMTSEPFHRFSWFIIRHFLYINTEHKDIIRDQYISVEYFFERKKYAAKRILRCCFFFRFELLFS